MDYDNVSTILTFPECANKSCVNISIVDDETVEKSKTFSISLASTDRRIIVDPDLVDGKVVIMDNEGECLLLIYVV